MRDLHAKVTVYVLWRIVGGNPGQPEVVFFDGVYSSEYHVEMRMDKVRETVPFVRFKYEAMTVGEPRTIPQEVHVD